MSPTLTIFLHSLSVVSVPSVPPPRPKFSHTPPYPPNRSLHPPNLSKSQQTQHPLKSPESIHFPIDFPRKPDPIPVHFDVPRGRFSAPFCVIPPPPPCGRPRRSTGVRAAWRFFLRLQLLTFSVYVALVAYPGAGELVPSGFAKPTSVGLLTSHQIHREQRTERWSDEHESVFTWARALEPRLPRFSTAEATLEGRCYRCTRGQQKETARNGVGVRSPPLPRLLPLCRSRSPVLAPRGWCMRAEGRRGC